MYMQVTELKQSARRLIEENILRFWLNEMQDNEHGGFFGRMDGFGRIHAHAEKGAILNARILWSFASAYRVLHKAEYLVAATRAKDYLMQHFIDREHGGVYWSVDYKGQPKETKKQTYAIGFAIYGLSEYARATGDREALDMAVKLFEDVERHAFDRVNIGYVEALTRDWQPIADMRLSDKDENSSRSMNTHLHILEPYTNLYRVWKDRRLEEKLRTLIGIFTEKLLNPRSHHLDLFFDDEWRGRRNIESYGHDIEAAWLLTEALEVLGDERLTEVTMPVVNRIAIASHEGICADGAMIHEKNIETGETDTDRHWWVQCECVIGEINQYQHFQSKVSLHRAIACYQYLYNSMVDWEHGEWYWSRHPDGSINRDEDKAGFWKCPYHNSRMCLEIIEREF